jgi:WD40 repeat protein
MTMDGHKNDVSSLSYLPDGKTMISGSWDGTVRRWDLQAGKEIEDARYVCEGGMESPGWVALSRDGRWVITLEDGKVLKAHDVGTGIVKTFQGNIFIDISADSTLLASDSDGTMRVWSLETGKLVAAFRSNLVCAIRFSQNSKKIAVNSNMGKCLEVWDVQTQRLIARLGVGNVHGHSTTHTPVIWTNKETILTLFNFGGNDELSSFAMIREFDSSTLETVGPSFEGHTKGIIDLALSFDGALFASTSHDHTIKLWSFESRQLLASFYVRNPWIIILSPDTRQLAYTRMIFPNDDDYKLYICNTPPDILACIGSAQEARFLHKVRICPHLLISRVITFSRRPVKPSNMYLRCVLRLFTFILIDTIAVWRNPC